MALETERKYLAADFAALRARLENCGARSSGVHFEHNKIFDTPDNKLFARNLMLRLRTQYQKEHKRSLLTFKGPEREREQFKVREEHETEIADPQAISCILEGLGYQVRARYEKIREIWRWQDVEIALDTLPFLQAVELEGEKEGIIAAALQLELDKAHLSVKNYHQLHQEWLARHHMPPALSFVFQEDERPALMRRLGMTNPMLSDQQIREGGVCR
ncbi:MAG: class IV adenylate cyclase [Desulfovibrio sp.]|jgi:adenylate cyclase class 2|nr:class IV adenylate cyclase [Desulfovibrio sp.]